MNKPAGTLCKLKSARLQMQAHGDTTRNSRVTHIAAALVLAVVLGGCGGGGGGSSPAVRPHVTYQTLSDAIIGGATGGASSSYSLTGNDLTLEGGTATVSLNSPLQTVSLVVNNLAGESFSFDVDLNTLGATSPANAPLNSLPQPCPDCLRTTFATASDGELVTFSYLDPASAGLAYSTLGLWSKPTSVSPADEVGAAFSIGVVTQQQDLPILGSATYDGFMVGRYTDGSHTYAVGANATANATFSVTGSTPDSTVTFNTSNTRIAQESGGGLLAPSAEPGLDLNGTLTYVPASNNLTGILTAAGVGNGALTGPATAKYYGPPTGADSTPVEFGGTFFVGNGAEQMNGSFALKK